MEPRRLFSAGALDPTFSGDGQAGTNPAGGFSVVAIDSRGTRTVVLGQSTGSAGGGVVGGGGNLVAYNGSGNLDTTFSGDGVRPIPRVARPTDLFVQADGKILVAGEVDGVPGVERILSNGGADTSFGSGGFVNLPQLTGEATSVRVGADGKVVVGGRVSNAAGTSQLAAVRLTAAGKVDTSFSGDGLASTFTASTDVTRTAVAVQPDGKVLVFGLVDSPDASDVGESIGVARFTSTGAIDATFATGGRYTYHDDLDDDAGTVELAPDGHVLLSVTLSASSASLIRLTAAGVQDLFFSRFDDDPLTLGTGAPTIASTSVRSSADGSQYYLFANPLLDDDGNPEPTSRIARYDSDGTRDYTFGTGGVLVAPNEQVGDLTSDGKLITAGNPLSASSSYNSAALQVRRRVTATADTDRIKLAGGRLTVEGTGGKDTITLATAGGTITVKLNSTTRTFPTASVTAIEVAGNAGDDAITATSVALRVTAFGGAGADKITTGAASDLVDGGDGNDTLTTNGGNDQVWGGAGDDLVTGGADADALYGDGGYRTDTFDVGKDRVYGGDGADLISGGPQSSLVADPNHQVADYLDGGNGDDSGVVGQGDAIFGVEHPVPFV